MIQHLKLIVNTPVNGLVAFAGNVAERDGQQDYRVWSIDPPMPMNQRLYRCDKEFILDPLQDMMADNTTYGLVAMDRREATIALLRGKAIQVLVNLDSMVPGKFRAGGQSAMRFERNRELAAKEFYRKIGEHLKEQFLTREELKGIIVGGPGPTKYDFVEGNNITNEVKKKIIAIKDITYTGEFGIQELLEKSQDVLAGEDVAQEKQIMQKFFTLLGTQPNIVTYGKDHVWQQLQYGVVDTVLLSEQVSDEDIARFEEEAEKYSTTVIIVSTDTREGMQLAQIGKIAAILRYEIHQG